jgi:hypothetical protein
MRVQITKRAGTLRVTPGSPISTKLKFALGIPGIQGEQGIQGYTGATTIGTGGLAFETRAAVEGATVEAVVKSVYTAGYTSAGDGGHGIYRRMLLAPTSPTNKAYIRSVDRYTSAGVINSTNGGYWELVPNGGVVYLEQFGGVADWNGTTGTDNYQPLIDAIFYTRFDPAGNTAQNHGPIIQIGFGKYKVTQTVHVSDVVFIRGAVGHLPDPFGFGGGSQFHFTNTSGSWFVFYSNNVGNSGTPGTLSETGGSWGGGNNMGSAAGSRCEGFTCHNASGVTTRNLARHGFNIRCQMTCDRVGVYSTAGHGFYVHAQAGHGGEHEGNANGWELISCFAHESRGDFMHIEGADTNAGVSYKFNSQGTAGIGGCGICDLGTLGSTHIQPQITGYGNLGVHYDGAQYQYLSGDSTTTPGTDNIIWYYLRDGGVTASFPEWDSGEDYSLRTIPIFTFSTATTVIAPYVEGSNVYSHGVGPVLGGGAPWTRYTPATATSSNLDHAWVTNTGLASIASFVGQTGAEQTRNGDTTWVKIGGEDESEGYGANGGLALLSHRRFSDGEATAAWGYKGNDISYGYLTQRPYWSQTTPSTTETFGRAAPVPYMKVLYDFALYDFDGFSGARIHGLRSAAPTTGSHARGEVMYNIDPSAGGFVGWVCVTSGTPGTWKTFGAISA